MGDIRCPRCGEPTDADALHDEIKYRLERGYPFYAVDRQGYALAPVVLKPYKVPRSPYSAPDRPAMIDRDKVKRYDAAYARVYAAIRAEWRDRGCPTLESYGAACNAPAVLSDDARELVGAIYDLAGADSDGAVSDLDDADALGLLS